MAKFQHLTRAILSRPWAIDPESVAWGAILDVLELRAAGETLSDAEIEARIAAANNGPRAGGSRNRNVAVIPIYGPISPRMSLMARSSGGTSAESIRDEFRAALDDADVDGIVFDVDSPGGVVEGIGELADEIRAARGTKPIAAVANHMAASAAYWIASAADEIVATPSATVGSIGVFTAHQDVSAAMEREGIRTTLISAGRFKVEGNRFEALGDEAKAAIQADVDAWYASMTGSIAKGRGVSVDVIRGESYGEGRGILAKKALEAGVVDRIDSLDNTIRRVARGAIGTKDKTGAAASIAEGAYIVTIADQPGSGESADDVATGSVKPFVDRIRTASAEVREIGAEARKRAAVRAAEGRSPSAATVAALAELRGSLETLDEPEEAPAEEVPEEETEEPTIDQPEQPAGRRNAALEVFEAALRGGYALPH